MDSDVQYERDDNLATRIAFHERYTVPATDFSRWVFDQMPLASGQRVLEVGCGNGEFWLKNADRVPASCDLVLTDRSQGMVEEAERRLREAGLPAAFHTASAEGLQFDGAEFDLIVAKHMLYHVKERDRALSHMAALLKPGGFFCASTNSARYMGELRDLMVAEGVDWRTDAMGGFVLENAEEQLSQHFGRVEQSELSGELVVTDAEAVVNYVRSGATLTTDPDRIAAALPAIRQKVAAVITQEGAFRISKRAGLFLCR